MRLVSIERSMACRKDVVRVNDKRRSANNGDGVVGGEGEGASHGNYMKELRESVCTLCVCVC